MLLLRHIVFEHFRIFFRPCRGPLVARLHHITWLVKRFCCRVIPSAEWLGQFVVKIAFITLVSDTVKFWRSANSFSPTVYFRHWIFVVAVDPCCQIENEFAAAEVLRTTGAVHVTSIFWKSEFFVRHIVPEHFRVCFSRRFRGPLAARSRPVVAGKTLEKECGF